MPRCSCAAAVAAEAAAALKDARQFEFVKFHGGPQPDPEPDPGPITIQTVAVSWWRPRRPRRPAYLCTRCCRFDKLGAAAGNLCAAAAAAAVASASAAVYDECNSSNSFCLECIAATCVQLCKFVQQRPVPHRLGLGLGLPPAKNPSIDLLQLAAS